MPRKKSNARPMIIPSAIRASPSVSIIDIRKIRKKDFISPGRLVAAAEYQGGGLYEDLHICRDR